METRIDGSHSLEDQRRSLHFAELAGPYKLVSFSRADYETLVPGTNEKRPLNKASFDDAPLGQDIPELIMAEISPPSSIDQVIAQQKAAGREIIFFSPAFVGGVEAMVAGFRKPFAP